MFVHIGVMSKYCLKDQKYVRQEYIIKAIEIGRHKISLLKVPIEKFTPLHIIKDKTLEVPNVIFCNLR